MDRFGFIGYAEHLCQGRETPAPLAHLFSLARDRECQFLLEETVDPDSVAESVAELRVLANLQKPPRKISRKIYRISFFSIIAPKVSIPESFAARCDGSVPLSTTEDNQWFVDNGPSLQCIGYLKLYVDLAKEYPIGAYVPEAFFCTNAFPAVQKPTSLQAYIHCAQTHKLKILGQVFSIHGTPFTQQEGLVWCCAHAAVQTCLRLMCDRGVEQFSIAKMNDIVGIDHVSRFGNDGLSLAEIKTIFKEAGLHAEIMQLKDGMVSPEDILLAAYHAIELGLPAVLSFRGRPGNHAMAVVGHTFDPSLWMSKADRMYFGDKSLGYLPSFVWVDKFVVQDDNVGPYHTVLRRDLLESVLGVVCPAHILYSPARIQRVQLTPASTPNLIEQSVASHLGSKVYWRRGKHENIFVTLQHDHHYRNNPWLMRLKEAVGSKRYVLRTTCAPKAGYLQRLQEVKATEVRQRLVNDLNHVEEVILVEISIPELYQWNHRCLGEAVIGLDENDDDVKIPFVFFMRLPGVGLFFGKHANANKGGGVEVIPLAAPEARYHCEIFK